MLSIDTITMLHLVPGLFLVTLTVGIVAARSRSDDS